MQKWDQFFSKVGAFDNLIYCTTNIEPQELKELPGQSGYDFIRGENASPDEMVQNALFYAVKQTRERIKRNPKMAFVKEGPYAVPLIS